jgi:hypothetical protein
MSRPEGLHSPHQKRLGALLARSHLVLLLAASLLCLAPAKVLCAPRVANEYDLKAAFVFNLVKFIEWPAAKFSAENSPLIIGVIGDEALDHFTRAFQEKSINQHKLLVRRLDPATNAPECHVLFISRTEQQRASEMAKAGCHAQALTVGETDQFLELGGMIGFRLESDELRLEINDRCVHEAGLQITASALSALVNKGIAKIRGM